VNDLIGLEYRWAARPDDGATDCFQLMCEVRRRLGLSDYSERFAWVYEEYSPETLNSSSIARWLLQSGKRIRIAKSGVSALLAQRNPALGTVVDGDLIFISSGQKVIRVPVSRVKAYYFELD